MRALKQGEDPDKSLIEGDAEEALEAAGAREVDGPRRKKSLIESCLADCRSFQCSSLYGSITSSNTLLNLR